MGKPSRAVLVTVGSTKFDALIKAVDSPQVADLLASRGYSSLVIQKGNGTYLPTTHLVTAAGPKSCTLTNGLSVEYFEYAPSLNDLIKQAALVISHAGSGSIFETLTAGVPLVVVPNPLLMDNHQAELGQKLSDMGHVVCASPEGLLAALRTFDASKLQPYAKGSANGIAQEIDKLMGFRPPES